MTSGGDEPGAPRTPGHRAPQAIQARPSRARRAQTRAALVLGACCLATAGPAGAQNAQANNPLANTTAVNVQTQYIGEFSGVGENGNQVYLRMAQPYSAFGARWIVRATLPINTWPVGTDGAHRTGLGDFNVFAAYLFELDNPAISFGIGPQLTVPSATEDALGSEKWSAGLANVLFNAANPKVQWGYLLTWQASFAGDDDRADVNIGAFQPFLFYQLGEGFYLRSSPVWTYDFESDSYAVPIGLGVGKVIARGDTVINAFVEPQYSVATRGDFQPEWGAFAGVNFQF